MFTEIPFKSRFFFSSRERSLENVVTYELINLKSFWKLQLAYKILGMQQNCSSFHKLWLKVQTKNPSHDQEQMIVSIKWNQSKNDDSILICFCLYFKKLVLVSNHDQKNRNNLKKVTTASVTILKEMFQKPPQWRMSLLVKINIPIIFCLLLQYWFIYSGKCIGCCEL